MKILTDKKVHIPTLSILNNENKKIINVKKKIGLSDYGS